MSDLRHQLAAVMKQAGYSQVYVSQALGLSPATLNQYLQGKYRGDNTGVDERARNFLAGEQIRARTPARLLRPVWVDTTAGRRALGELAYAHATGTFCVLCGAAGTGKTMLLREYAARHPDVVLIDCVEGISSRAMLLQLCTLLKIRYRPHDTAFQLFSTLRQALGEAPRLLLLDEAELLSYHVLETLRRLCDLTGAGLVLAGMPKLLTNLTGRVREFAQLYSRVALFHDLGDGVSKDDFTLIVRSLLPDADEGLVARLREESRSLPRLLFNIARGMADCPDLTPDTVSSFAARLPGTASWLKRGVRVRPVRHAENDVVARGTDEVM